MYNVYTNHSMLQFGSSQHEDAKIPILMKAVNDLMYNIFHDNKWQRMG